MTITHVLYKGNVNRELTVEYVYNFISNHPTLKPTISSSGDGYLNIQSYYGIRIQEKYGKDNKMWITSKQYWTMISLLKKAVTLMTDNLYKLYPNIGSASFQVDQIALERFQSEKSLYSNNITIQPSIWFDQTDQPYPAIEINTIGSTIKIPFEDALGIIEMFQCFDPNSFGINLLRLLGKIE